MTSPTNLREMLIQDEALKLTPYRDTGGKLHIGVGRNLEDKGITKEECLYLLDNDVREKTSLCAGVFRDFWSKLDPVRKDVLISMAFNMGMGRLVEFKNMIAALRRLDYFAAAGEMINSHWAKEVGDRSHRLAQMMADGKYPSGY